MVKKKICYITTISLTIKSFFIKQLKYLAQNNFDVYVICSQDDELQKQLGDEITYIPVEITRGIAVKTLKKSINDLAAIFKTEKFDLVQYSTPNAAFCAAIAAKRAGIKIRNYHLMGFRYLGFKGISKFLFKTLERVTCALSTHIECITPSNVKLGISDKIFRQDKVTIVWNGSTGGVELKKFEFSKRKEWREEIRAELGYSDDDFVFGFVGRITRDKGINELLNAFYGLSGDSNLLLVGQEENIEELDLDLYNKAKNEIKIKFHKPVEDVEKYYAAIDVLVLPSYREGFGMVIAEAAAMGTPAIVSDIPGPIDVIEDKKTAFTVGVKDSEDLREKMQMFADNPRLATEMSADCVEFVKNNFDADILCEKILDRKLSLLD